MRLIRVILLCTSALCAVRATEPDISSFAGVQLENGFNISLYADDTQVANPVTICFDRQGNLYPVEAHRRLSGAWGVTMSRWWSMEDYAGKSLADREAMYARWAHIVPPARLTRDSDFLRKISDADGDGRADKSLLLLKFNGPLEGNAAGVLADDEGLIVANAPNIWRVRSDGETATREKLLTGLGVRVGVYGHDLHGLVMGPDGRLYFSLGDRGFNLQSQEGKHFYAPTRGAVFRCFPDGTGLELFHIGLRNPQDLDFNEFGDLFTVDNDMGGVDRSRVVYVVEGGDSGWDASYQLTRNFREETKRHDHIEPPWFTEGLWKTNHPGQPQWLHPPIAYLTQGPSGMEFDPGGTLPDHLRNNFFVCDFKGSATRSGILNFRLVQRGASYEMVSTNRFAWGVTPADIEFGWDGSLYVADWLNGWGGEGKRRIAKIAWDKARKRPNRIDSAKQYAARSIDELIQELGHPDRRIRQLIQFEIAKRGTAGRDAFIRATAAKERTKRIHGIWGLWQMGLKRDDKLVAKRLTELLSDSDDEVIAQSLKAIGEIGHLDAFQRVKQLLRHESARVAYFATIALGRICKPNSPQNIAPRHEATRAMYAALELHGDDRTFRHAVSISIPSRLKFKLDADAHHARSAKIQTPHARNDIPFNKIESEADRNEIVRLVHDHDQATTLPGWSAPYPLSRIPLADYQKFTIPNQHRLLNAHYRLGRSVNAQFLATAANAESIDPLVRIETLKMLTRWNTPSDFDWVTWRHRPIPRQGTDGTRTWKRFQLNAGFGGRIAPLLSNSIDAQIRKYAIQASLAHGWLTPAKQIEIVRGGSLNVDDQLRIINNLRTDASHATKLGRHLQTSKDALLKSTGLLLLAEQSDADATEALSTIIEKGAAAQKLAFANATRQLKLDRLPPSLMSAARKSITTGKIEAHSYELALLTKTGSKPDDDFRFAQAGGDRMIGERIFKTHAIQCVRCHVVKGFGGDAGPELTKIGRSLKRPELIQALIEPSTRIASGFGLFEIELKTGEELAGFVEEENKEAIQLRTVDGRRLHIDPANIASRSQPTSAMPTMKAVLTLEEIRDLVAYLESLK